MTLRNGSTLSRLAPLVALVAFTVLPHAWVARRLGWLNDFVNWLFASEAAHAVGHTLIFAAVGATLLWIFPALLGRPRVYFALILGVALAQEGMQLLTKGRGVVVNDVTDICIDLVGAGVVFAIARLAARRRTAPARVVE